MTGRNPGREAGVEPFFDARARDAETAILHDAEPTVLLLDQPSPISSSPEPSPVFIPPASNLASISRSGSGGLYIQNPFVAAGMNLLLRLAPLRLMMEHPNANSLHAELLSELKQLTALLRERGFNEIATSAARYIFCAALDEAVLSTPWGARSVWSQRSLLATLHGETWGGEKLFAMLSEFQNDVDGNIDLIELIDICLALGFKGRYRLVEQGESQLHDLRISLGRLISTRRQPRPSSLSGPFIPETGVGQLRGWLPTWVTALACGLLGAGLYVFLYMRISDQNSMVIRTLRLIQATE